MNQNSFDVQKSSETTNITENKEVEKHSEEKEHEDDSKKEYKDDSKKKPNYDIEDIQNFDDGVVIISSSTTGTGETYESYPDIFDVPEFSEGVLIISSSTTNTNSDNEGKCKGVTSLTLRYTGPGPVTIEVKEKENKPAFATFTDYHNSNST